MSLASFFATWLLDYLLFNILCEKKIDVNIYFITDNINFFLANNKIIMTSYKIGDVIN